jgi:hypothetical protein
LPCAGGGKRRRIGRRRRDPWQMEKFLPRLLVPERLDFDVLVPAKIACPRRAKQRCVDRMLRNFDRADLRFVPKQKSAILPKSPPWHSRKATTTSLLDWNQLGKPTTRQINQRSLSCRCYHAGLRALRSTVDPGLDQFPGGFLTSRSGFAA